MAISSGQYMVSTTPIPIHTSDEDGVTVIVNATQNIYLGSANVSVGAGDLHTKTDPPLHLDLGPGEILYAIRAGTQDALVTTLRTKNQ